MENLYNSKEKGLASGRDSLEQACTTYGPRAKCGPQKLLIWPAEAFNLARRAPNFV